MHKREFEIYLDDEKKLVDLLEKRKPYAQFTEEEVYSKPFDIDTLEGFEIPGDFPNCCKFHKNVAAYIKDWFIEFPNCCDRHKAYLNMPWFNKNKFLNVPDKIITQILQTEYFIKTHIDDVDWYKKIIDYLEYNLFSFGSPEIGADRYRILIEHYIEYAKFETSKIDESKRKKFTAHFEKIKDQKKNKKADMNILYSTFQKWVKSIPQIGYFQIISRP